MNFPGGMVHVNSLPVIVMRLILLRCILLIEGDLNSLNVMAQFDGWTQLQLHAFLDGRQRQE